MSEDSLSIEIEGPGYKARRGGVGRGGKDKEEVSQRGRGEGPPNLTSKISRLPIT